MVNYWEMLPNRAGAGTCAPRPNLRPAKEVRMTLEVQDPGGTAGAVADVIATEGLTKVFAGRGGEVRAVDDLNLRVQRGEIFGLLGPNGAGKTTTVGMLTTRVIPTAGTASVGGIDVVAHPAAAKKVIGVVPQTNTLDRALDVAENLYFHGRYFGMNAREAHTRTAALLEQFRLADRAQAERRRDSRAGWRSGSWWPAQSCTPPTCCSSTSRLRASIRRAASRSGT